MGYILVWVIVKINDQSYRVLYKVINQFSVCLSVCLSVCVSLYTYLIPLEIIKKPKGSLKPPWNQNSGVSIGYGKRTLAKRAISILDISCMCDKSIEIFWNLKAVNDKISCISVILFNNCLFWIEFISCTLWK